jgi:hypothetical protein
MNISRLAALADCLEGVDMERVAHYRQMVRAGQKIDPIIVCDINPQGFYVIKDGHHRTIAHAFENYATILVHIDSNLKIMNISWRWPCIAPISHTIELLKLSGEFNVA